MASKTDKQVDAWMRGQVLPAPQAVKPEKPLTPSQAFTATLRASARRGWHTMTPKKEADDAPTP